MPTQNQNTPQVAEEKFLLIVRIIFRVITVIASVVFFFLVTINLFFGGILGYRSSVETILLCLGLLLTPLGVLILSLFSKRFYWLGLLIMGLIFLFSDYILQSFII